MTGGSRCLSWLFSAHFSVFQLPLSISDIRYLQKNIFGVNQNQTRNSLLLVLCNYVTSIDIDLISLTG